MSADRSTTPAKRRAPGRLELAHLTLQMHGRAIAWGAGLLTLTLTLATLGILRTVTVGDPIAHTGVVTVIPSSKSIHVEVELGDGIRVMVPRADYEDLVVGDQVALTETQSALGTTGFQLTEVVID